MNQPSDTFPLEKSSARGRWKTTLRADSRGSGLVSRGERVANGSDHLNVARVQCSHLIKWVK